MSYKGPDETTWQRATIAEGNHELFNFAHGKHGPWKFWQQPDGNVWTEAEMLQVDELMRRVCDIDRAHWRFTRFTDDHHTCHFSASAPSWDAPGMQSQTFEEFLARLESHWIDIFLVGGFGTGQRECDVCKAEVWSETKTFGLKRWELVPHYEAEHPEELAAIRATRLERMERLRDYYRNRDTHYHAELDGPREPRTFIL